MVNSTSHFASRKNFLDLQYSRADRDITTKLMETLIEERYYISKFTHTSYIDIDEITPLERKSLVKLVIEDIQAKTEASQKAISAIKEI